MAYATTHPAARMLRPANWLLAALVGLALALGMPLSALAAPTVPAQSVSPLVGATTSPSVLPVPVQPHAASGNTDSVQLADTGGKKKAKKHKKKRHYHIKWSVRVKNHGGQRAIDACRHGLTRWGTVYGKRYYAIHNYCGGGPILHLHKGDVIKINGKKYKVVSTRVVRKGAKVSAVRGMKGSALLQTCYWHSKKMRVVGVKRL